MGLLEGVHSTAAAEVLADTLRELEVDDTHQVTSDDFSIFCYKIEHLRNNQVRSLSSPNSELPACHAAFSLDVPALSGAQSLCDLVDLCTLDTLKGALTLV
eukprot:2532016-Pyramimonas_sp.AAC.3